MIRKAEEKDLRRIVEMAERFYPMTTYFKYSRIPFSPEIAASLASGMMEGGILHVAEIDDEVVGMVSLVLMPFIFNHDYIHAGEIIWWVEPEFQKTGLGEQLLRSVEKPAKDAGAIHIQMIDLLNSPLSAAKLYEKLGYVPTERIWTKVT